MWPSHKKYSELKVFDFPSRFGTDEAWGRAKIDLPKFKFDKNHKYLNSKKRIFENIKEIKYRMMGLSAKQVETLLCIDMGHSSIDRTWKT